MLRRATPALTALLILFSTPAAFALTITLDPGGVSVVQSGTAGLINSSLLATVPDSGSVTAASGGDNSTTGYSLSSSVFEITFDHSRGITASTAAGIFFSPDENVDYELDGLYIAVDVDGGLVQLVVALTDITASSVLASSSQSSSDIANQSFSLAGDGSLVGSLTGTLIAGHTYRLDTQSNISDGDVENAGATATGFVSLTFVPEPTTAALVALGLAGLVVRRRGGA